MMPLKTNTSLPSFSRQGGQSLIELLVAIGVAAVVLPAVLTGFVASRQGRIQQSQRLLATALLGEAEEAVRIVREKDWNTFAVNGTFHPVASVNSWSLAAGSEIINGFTRSAVVSDVRRDTSGQIVDSGGSIDPSTKEVTASVAWSSLFPSSVSTSQYFTRHRGLIHTETTQADFEAGTKTNVVVTDTDGGEVTLAAGGRADWCAPNLSIPAADLPKQGVANAVSAIEGRVFAGTGENASGVSFSNVAVSNADPPAATVSGTFDGYKTNGIFGEANYAYLATDNNFKEVVIIDLTQLDPTTHKYTEAGYFNAPGNGNGEGVFVSGSTGYMTSGAKLYNFDLGLKTGSRGLIDPDGVTLAGTGEKAIVVGGFAYVAVGSTGTQLQIIDVGTNPSDMRVVGQAQLPAAEAHDVFVNQTGTRAYLATRASVTQRELFIIDVTTKGGDHAALGSYEANGMTPKGVAVVPGNRAILVGTAAEEYQVIALTNEASPVRCGGLDIDTGVNGVAAVLESDGDAYSYIITGDASSELKIIEGGPGGKFATSGTFESATFDAGNSVAFNRFSANAVRPEGTEITYQIGITDAAGGSCLGVSFAFVGPDLTSTSYFATSSAIPFSAGPGYKNPAQCFRYRAYLTSSDSTIAPIFTDMTVNYSP